jgi:putative DNA methylase
MPKDCKQLAELDFPIAEVSRHATREKVDSAGTRAPLHLWTGATAIGVELVSIAGAALAEPM